MVAISHFIWISKHYIVDLKYIQFLFVNYFNKAGGMSSPQEEKQDVLLYGEQGRELL